MFYEYGPSTYSTNLFPLIELWVNELAIDEAGPLRHRGEKPEDKDDLHLVVEGQPGNK